ncbi:hypothetical protein O7627_20495 [Solwaraspora sp. WMMD1047]|uniref:hypothetical protein n=1 Tax=Solwaraspora sp. WMMD1047 TaxID=3016102 RepID=UPI0024161D85|nr:hypothetical protein [Solwaraspora sp. WMMD1047]MDG4831664.1 hypothetical protein [Solwaraspora sp. WMMD1047]
MADGSELDEAGWRVWSGLHRLLFRFAGRVPDEWLTHARGMLGSGDLNYLPDTISGSLLELDLPLRPAEAQLLRDTLVLLGVDGDEPAGLARVRISDEPTPATGHRFHPAPPAVLAEAGARIPPSLDLTGGDPDDLAELPADLAHLDDLALDLTDQTDDRALGNATGQDGTISLWRAWRFGPQGPPVGGRRVYLIEVTPGTPAWDITHELQRELIWKGEESPQVEVFWTGDELTPYHRAALAGAARLWVRP